jgi:hypothetical protein
MSSFFPKYQTVEHHLNQGQTFSAMYEGKFYRIWLDRNGMFCARVDIGGGICKETLRDCMDELYNQLNRKAVHR